MKMKNRFVPNLHEKKFNGENVKAVKLNPDNVLEIYSLLDANVNIKTSDNELVVSKNNNLYNNYSLSLSKDGKVYPISAPYQELQAEYDAFNLIYNGFVSFTDAIKNKIPDVNIVNEEFEEND